MSGFLGLERLDVFEEDDVDEEDDLSLEKQRLRGFGILSYLSKFLPLWVLLLRLERRRGRELKKRRCGIELWKGLKGQEELRVWAGI